LETARNQILALQGQIKDAEPLTKAEAKKRKKAEEDSALGKNGFVDNDKFTGKDHNPYFHRWQDGVDFQLPLWEWVYLSYKRGLQLKKTDGLIEKEGIPSL